MGDSLNRSARCSLCALDLVAARIPVGYKANTRIRVGPADGTGERAVLCPTHDLAGPVMAYPAHVVEALTPPTA